MSKIILESPFSNKDQNKFNDNYFYLCLVARKLMKEEDHAPLFFHALYTQFLHDNKVDERNLGLFKSFEWHTNGDYKLYAIDRGISYGMILGAKDAIEKGMPVMFYTAMPENHWISKRVSEINETVDNQTRWDKGLDLMSELDSELAEKTGDLTGYSKYNEDLITEVKDCILSFFAPLVDSIRNER